MRDEYFMNLALIEAKKGAFSTSPNPKVGCVLVKNNRVISSGYHEMAGKQHAEIMAINNLECGAEGVTAYVTLEPCSHYGRTPPCCDTLIALGVSRVVTAMQDPNPLVAGRGINAMKQAGIEVQVGVCESDAQNLNRGYVKRMLGRGPWLTGKLALRGDGHIASTIRESECLPGELIHRDLMEMRARCCAILINVQTILSDDPLLNVLMPEYHGALKQPDLLILDPGLCLNLDARVLTTLPHRNIRVIALERHASSSRQDMLRQLGCEVYLLPSNDGEICQHALRHWLISSQYNEIMVEGGPTLMEAMLRSAVLDELIVYQVPGCPGADASEVIQKQLMTQYDIMHFEVGSYENLGQYLKIQFLLSENENSAELSSQSSNTVD